jgi:ketosteroid isomerase-like protein
VKTCKILPTLAAGLLLATSSHADDRAASEVEKAINTLNEAFTKGQADTIKALMTADHVSVTPYYGGPVSRDQQVKGVADYKLTEYTPARMKVTMLGKDAALVTYALTMKGTYKGKELPRKNFASAVWVRRGGKWLESFYQETALSDR